MSPPRPTISAVVAIAMAAIGALICILAFPYLPTHDGPQQIYTALAWEHLADPAHPLHQFLERGRPITALGFFAPWQLTPTSWDWMDRTRAVLLFIVLLHGTGFALLYRRLHGRWSPLAALGFPLAFQWSFYMGFFPFLAAVGLAFFALACHAGISSDRRPWLSRLLTGLVLLLAAASHIFPAALAGAVILLHELLSGKRSLGGLAQSTTLAALMGLPTLLLVAAVWLAAIDPLVSNSPVQWSSWLERISTLPRMVHTAPWWLALVPWLAFPLSLAMLSLASLRNATGPLLRTLALTSLLFLTLGFTAPLTGLGWEFFGPRFLALALPLALLAASSLPRAREATTESSAKFGPEALALLWVLASLTSTYTHHRHLVRESTPLLELLAEQPPSTRSSGGHRSHLGINLQPQLDDAATPVERRLPFALPWLNQGLLFAGPRGDFAAGFYGALPAIHPVIEPASKRTLHPPPPGQSYYRDLAVLAQQPDDLHLRAILSELAAAGAGWGEISLFGPPEQLQAILSRGYQVEQQSTDGRAAIARFRGCPAQVEFSPSESARPVILEVYWAPLLVPTTRQPFTLPAHQEPRPVALSHAPCGPVRVRIFEDRNGNGVADPDDRFCQGSRQGLFSFENQAGAVLSCQWE